MKIDPTGQKEVRMSTYRAKLGAFAATLMAIAALFLALTIAAPSPALAQDDGSQADSESFEDTAGNSFFAGNTKEYQKEKVDNSLFWAGQSLTVADSNVENDLFAAGQEMSLSGSNIGASAFVAGQNLSAQKTKFDGNLFFAGQTLSLDEDSSAKAIYAACSDLTMEGTADYALIAAGNVVLDGTIEGNATVIGDNVIIGPNANIKGNLEVKAPEEPSVPASANIGSMTYTYIDDEALEKAEDTAEQAAIGATVFAFVSALIGAAIAGLLIYWLNRRTLSTAAEYLRTRPISMLASGLVTVIALPLAAILAFVACSWPIGASFIMAAAIITLLSSAFTGASLLQMLAPKFNSIAASVLGAAAFTLLCKIPFIGFIFGAFAVLYTTGYVVQWVFLNSLGKPKPKQPEMAQPNTETINQPEWTDPRNQPPTSPIA